MNFGFKLLQNLKWKANQILYLNILKRGRRKFIKFNQLKKMSKSELNENKKILTILKEKINENHVEKEVIIIDDEDKSLNCSINKSQNKNLNNLIKTLAIKPKTLLPQYYRITEKINEKNLVFFDLETGGLSNLDDILQIGAIDSEEKEFNVYITPTKKISSRASRVHHITYKDGQMYYKNNPVSSFPLEEALYKFFDNLNSITNSKIVLVAHNAIFDRRFLINKLYKFGLEQKFSNKILGFIDTLPLFKDLLPGKKNYKQENLVNEYFLNSKYENDSHNAIVDVIYLKKLYDKLVKPILSKNEKYHNNFSTTFEYGLLKQKDFFTSQLKIIESTLKENNNKIRVNRKRSAAIFENGQPIAVSNVVKKIKPKRLTRSTLRLNKAK